MAQQQQDVETLKRRGRRRLVGAVALILLAVIVLPMVFDPQPPPPAPPVSVHVPAESEPPLVPQAKQAPGKPQAPAAVEKQPAEEVQGEYIVPVGAFSNADTALERLAAANVPYYTESQGNLTRVRAGPFATRDAAQKALQKLKGLGFSPGEVTIRAG